MAVLLISVLALSFSMSTAFAADNTTKTVKTTKNIAAGSPATASFTSSQINTASSNVKKFVEKNKRLPNYVTIKNSKVTMPQFLKLITVNTVNLNNKKSKSVTISTVKNPSTTSSENVKTGTLSKSKYVTVAKQVNQYITKYKKAPSSLNTSLGKMNFQNMVYTFSKVLAFQSTHKRLPNTVSVKPWKVLSKKVTSEGLSNTPGKVSGLRPVYIISDNINNRATDNARINALKAALNKLGISAVNYGISPGQIWKLLADKRVPSNALIVEIAGGADSGSIKEKGSAYFQKLLNKKEDYIVFTQGAKKITGLSWLVRAHDDNYSPASFKGLAHPDKYLLSQGVGYFEGLTSSKYTACAQAIYKFLTGK